MSLLGTSTSLRSVTGCLVAGQGLQPNPHPNSVGPSQVAPRASGIENRQVITESMLWGHINGPIFEDDGTSVRSASKITAGDNEEYATKLWPSFPRCSMKNQGEMCRRRGPEPERPEGASEDTRRQTCRPSFLSINRRIRVRLRDEASRPRQWCERHCVSTWTFRSGGRTPALAAGPQPAERTIRKNEKKIYLLFSSKMIHFRGESN